VPGCSHILVAHALPESTYSSQDVGVGICGNGGGTRVGQSFLDQDMGTNALIDVIHPDSVFPGILPAFVLIGCIFLVRSGGIAIESEKSAGCILQGKLVLFHVLDNVGSPKITGHPGIYGYIHDFTWLNPFPA